MYMYTYIYIGRYFQSKMKYEHVETIFFLLKFYGCLILKDLKKTIYLFFFLAMICISNDKFSFGYQLKIKTTGLSLWLNTKHLTIYNLPTRIGTNIKSIAHTIC